MGISINSNISATRASQFLATNHQNLQKSLDRLSSGKRITEPADDAGGMAVSMKLENEINQLEGAANNIANAISFLQVQDGILENIGNIVMRLGELKSMSEDVLQNGSTIYDSEVADLSAQLLAYNTTATIPKFNGVNLLDSTSNLTVTAAGQSITISRHDIGTALTSGDNNSDDFTGLTVVGDITSADDVNEVLEQVAALRAVNGGEANQLKYALADVSTQVTNLTAAYGRIMDVDIAAESANLARQQILVQASAAMTAQANTSNDVALLLLQ